VPPPRSHTSNASATMISKVYVARRRRPRRISSTPSAPLAGWAVAESRAQQAEVRQRELQSELSRTLTALAVLKADVADLRLELKQAILDKRVADTAPMLRNVIGQARLERPPWRACTARWRRHRDHAVSPFPA